MDADQARGLQDTALADGAELRRPRQVSGSSSTLLPNHARAYVDPMVEVINKFVNLK